ncbi:MAG: DUF4169 family protein [Pelagimonas sp.]|jgi:hypothetical protein|nr:DUF4169 family protein [Pelagimonas sp.]
MSKIVNLNQFRKTRARDDKRRKADDNAALHGLKKSEKELAKARRDKAKRDLDGHECDT